MVFYVRIGGLEMDFGHAYNADLHAGIDPAAETNPLGNALGKAGKAHRGDRGKINSSESWQKD
jgi:hypothetical protein